VAQDCKSALKAPQIKMLTPFPCNNCKRSTASSSGILSSRALPSSGLAGKIMMREHQLKTGATRPLMTGMAIISFGLQDVYKPWSAP